jgi:hypothetical protein
LKDGWLTLARSDQLGVVEPQVRAATGVAQDQVLAHLVELDGPGGVVGNLGVRRGRERTNAVNLGKHLIPLPKHPQHVEVDISARDVEDFLGGGHGRVHRYILLVSALL